MITLQFIHSSPVKNLSSTHIAPGFSNSPSLLLSLSASLSVSPIIYNTFTHYNLSYAISTSVSLHLSFSLSLSLSLCLLSFNSLSLCLSLSFYSLSLSHTLRIHLTCCQASTARRVVRLDLSQVGSGHRLLSQCYPLCVELEITSEKKRVRDRETESRKR